MREIARDESGFEGSRLVGGVTDVLAHAGVDLAPSAAAGCVAELRRRIRSPAEEYEADHLLRGRHRGTLLWLFGPSGPVLGHAHVHLVDKTALARSGADPDLLVPALLAARVPCEVRFVPASTDARVQVADFLPGVARRAASEALLRPRPPGGTVSSPPPPRRSGRAAAPGR